MDCFSRLWEERGRVFKTKSQWTSDFEINLKSLQTLTINKIEQKECVGYGARKDGAMVKII